MKDAGIRMRDQELRVAWAAFLGRVRWQHFVTLMFDPKRRFRPRREIADREMPITSAMGRAVEAGLGSQAT